MNQPMIRRIGLHLSLLGMALLVGAPLHAAAQPPMQDRAAVSEEQLLATQRAWLDQGSQKALRPTSDPDVWSVLASRDETDWKAFGTVRLLSSFAIEAPPAVLGEAMVSTPYTLIERRMVAASVLSETGQLHYVAALVMDFGQSYLDRERNPIRPFAVVFFSEDLDLTVDFARQMAQVYNGQRPAEPTTGDRLQVRCGCEDACDASWQEDLNLCLAESLLCETIATAAAVACILACPPCAPACLAAEAAALALCLVQQQQCQKAANREHLACRHECIIVP